MKISKDGFEDFVGAPFGGRPMRALATGISLDPEGSRPEGMIGIVGGFVERPQFQRMAIGPYWLDQFEVTNLQFKQFLDSGGYLDQRHWSEQFVDQGRQLTREEAMARFQDTTGRPGPAGWELGSFLDGHGSHRQRAARVVCASSHAADDQHLHAGRAARSG